MGDRPTIEEARGLAQRWAVNVAFDGGVVDGLNGKERYSLFTWAWAWVSEAQRDAAPERFSRQDLAANLAIALNLGDGDSFDEEAALALLDAAVPS